MGCAKHDPQAFLKKTCKKMLHQHAHIKHIKHKQNPV